MAENSYPGVSIWAHGRSHSRAIQQHRAEGGTGVLNGRGGRGQEAGMGENTGSGGGAARTSPTAGALGEAGLVPRSCRWCVSGTRVSGRGASGQLAATWGKCGLSAGAEGGRRSASAGAGSPPARPAAAALRDPAPPSLPPAAAPQRRPPLAPDFSHRPRRVATAHTAVPGLPRWGRARGAPRLPPRAGRGRGS